MSRMQVTYDIRGRGAGKSYDLAWGIVEYLAEVAWSEALDPPRQAVVLVVPELSWLKHPALSKVLTPHLPRICVASSATLNNRTRGIRDVPWFADDVDLCKGGLAAVVEAARQARALSLHWTSSEQRP